MCSITLIAFDRVGFYFMADNPSVKECGITGLLREFWSGIREWDSKTKGESINNGLLK
jgi:hypothetical protein